MDLHLLDFVEITRGKWLQAVLVDGQFQFIAGIAPWMDNEHARGVDGASVGKLAGVLGSGIDDAAALP